MAMKLMLPTQALKLMIDLRRAGYAEKIELTYTRIGG